MVSEWLQDAVFYHIYPLGLCAAPPRNDFQSDPVPRLDVLSTWLDHIQGLGANAIYLGPLFESGAHGYDTADYFRLDRRLGTNETLQALIAELKRRGLRVVLDAVFNHVGRDFWAFRDVIARGQESPYCGWFSGLTFDRSSPKGDPFTYDTWAGHYSLVKLNLDHAGVRRHLLDAVTFWIDQFDIDGLRLDAADHIQPDFFGALRAHCDQRKPGFWLMGEVVHGDYRRWANPSMLDATTNYECYKGLYSSHVDRNYFEIAYSFNRQFGSAGMYRDLLLYNFVDNHDVNRIASSLSNPAHLYTVYGLLFTMPGIPSIYYGSEWGIDGRRTDASDRALRPALDLSAVRTFPHPDLAAALRRFAAVRHAAPALRCGDYRQVYLTHEQFAFERRSAEQTIIVAVNAADHEVTIDLDGIAGSTLRDLLNDGAVFRVQGGRVAIPVPKTWLRILAIT
ncbi:MAG: alpha-glucosidase C-terminal domain-containing protein [Anaerolinea sp.]|nr:alpha-glucosidase C-terminal domain-containing protein [Anaerolinea sp.]